MNTGSGTGPVMLALSSFRRSEDAVAGALARAGNGGRLVLVFIVDINLSRYMYLPGVGVYPDWSKRCEEELLMDFALEGRREVERVRNMAAERNVSGEPFLRIGRFGVECVEIAAATRPEVIFTTRAKRPQWLRRMFGSPVDHLITHAGCPVIECPAD